MNIRNRILIFFIIALCPSVAFTQGSKNLTLKSDRVFYSLAYYDLFENNISGSFLEKLVKVSYGFGDKTLAKEIVLRQMIFSIPDDKLIDILYLHKEDSFLKSLPALSNNPLERPSRLLSYYIINELLKFNTDNFYENFTSLAPRIEKMLRYEVPKKSEGVNQFETVELANGTDDISQNIVQYINLIQWSGKNIKDLKFLISYVLNDWQSYKKEYPNATMEDMYQSNLEIANQMYPIIDYFLPIPLAVCIEEYDRQNSVIPNAEYVLANPRQFIEDTYLKLLHRKPTDDEMSAILPQYDCQTPLAPGILYYLIMSSGEYQYY